MAFAALRTAADPGADPSTRARLRSIARFGLE